MGIKHCECGEKMQFLLENEHCEIYKCRHPECGRLVLIDRDTGEEVWYFEIKLDKIVRDFPHLFRD